MLKNVIKNIDRELILILFVVASVALLQFVVVDQRLFLNFFFLPVLFGAYHFGKRAGALSALLSVSLVTALTLLYPERFHSTTIYGGQIDKWMNIGVWGGFLMITGYSMGVLYERQKKTYDELRETYRGVLNILNHFISRDTYTQNHSHRVSIYAKRLAIAMKLDPGTTEDIRLAGLLHDIGKLNVSAQVIHKAMKLTEDEYDAVKGHPEQGVAMISAFGGPLKRIVPYILYHHEWYDGSGYFSKGGEDIPLGASILAVADAFDAMTTDRSYRKDVNPWEAKEEIVRMSGIQFNPKVANVFVRIFNESQLDDVEEVVYD